MFTEEIVSFLIRAKRATYAGKGAQAASSRPLSHDLVYQEGNLLYIDTYVGTERFAGEEALWLDGKPIWSMNYIGRVLAPGFEGDFLKQALWHVPPIAPFRGPESFEKGDFTYRCHYDGDHEWFSGHEQIYRGGVWVYECMFHGGKVIETGID